MKMWDPAQLIKLLGAFQSVFHVETDSPAGKLNGGGCAVLALMSLLAFVFRPGLDFFVVFGVFVTVLLFCLLLLLSHEYFPPPPPPKRPHRRY